MIKPYCVSEKTIKQIQQFVKNKNPTIEQYENFLITQISKNKNDYDYVKELVSFLIINNKFNEAVQIIFDYYRKIPGFTDSLIVLSEILSNSNIPKSFFAGITVLLDNIIDNDKKTVNFVVNAYMLNENYKELYEILMSINTEVLSKQEKFFIDLTKFNCIFNLKTGDECLEYLNNFLKIYDKSYFNDLNHYGFTCFQAGKNVEGLKYHFGGEDFRPAEFGLIPLLKEKNTDTNDKKVLLVSYRAIGDTLILFRFVKEYLKKYPRTKFSLCVNSENFKRLCEKMNIFENVETQSFYYGKIFDYVVGINQIFNLLDIEDDNVSKFKFPSISGHKKINFNTKNIVVGVNWKGSQVLSGDKGAIFDNTRDIPLKEYVNIFEMLPEVTFVTLNNEIDEEEIKIISNYENVIVYKDKLKDLYDTHNLIKSCGLVVSTDTSISTLSASLEIPTVVTLKHMGDYRWNQYEKWWNPELVTVFRQKYMNESWTNVIFSVIRTIKKLNR